MISRLGLAEMKFSAMWIRYLLIVSLFIPIMKELIKVLNQQAS